MKLKNRRFNWFDTTDLCQKQPAASESKKISRKQKQVLVAIFDNDEQTNTL